MLNFLLSIPVLLFAACSGPGSETGFAPGMVHTPITLPTTTATEHIKYGEVVHASNGWTVSSDYTDPVQQKTLSNRWTVEVKYE